MLYPSIDELVRKVDSKYTLVVAASKRARGLREGKLSQLTNPKSHKVVGVALEEIYQDYVSVEALKAD
ncbi:DNA-directed RNA polymerase subunit omega [Cohnella thailandensis]|uniref:DNA-directed RNA polymerase subunit omega n=1 Tax=Cohnella thailandensis TaxID=557557 RepID=A0A841T3D3_9BACL|nr:DNA-directed RNA polymerase subunit omega [Cohnella thailandensis]MBB6636560.1 DNA-directed RNA polymerase subunit omega [Cohnella thailandensis]MBP1973566.1 DNA-directed RNA polymerase subunit omega [Cohnella thailandensis]